MANATTNLDLIAQNQAAKEKTANALFDAGSPATCYGRRLSTTNGVTWGYYGGVLTLSDGSKLTVANGTIALTANAVNYLVVLKTTGALSVSTSATNWNDAVNYMRLYQITVDANSLVTDYIDHRSTLYTNVANGGAPTIPAMTINDQTGTSYTLALTDKENYVRISNAAACTITVAPDATVAFPLGSSVYIRQAGAGQLTIAAGSGVTINTPETLKARRQHSSLSLVRVGTDTWDLTGDLEQL